MQKRGQAEYWILAVIAIIAIIGLVMVMRGGATGAQVAPHVTPPWISDTSCPFGPDCPPPCPPDTLCHLVYRSAVQVAHKGYTKCIERAVNRFPQGNTQAEAQQCLREYKASLQVAADAYHRCHPCLPLP